MPLTVRSAGYGYDMALPGQQILFIEGQTVGHQPLKK